MSSSTIDHIYSNGPEIITETNVPQYAISDHLPVCFKMFSGSKICKSKHTFIHVTYRSFRNFSKEKIQSELAHAPVEAIEIEDDVNDSISVFYNILNKVISYHAPLKRQRVNGSHKGVGKVALSSESNISLQQKYLAQINASTICM